MEDENLTVSPQIRSEAGLLLDQLLALGWEICASRYSPEVMGNWFVELRRNEIRLRLIKDRGQYSVDGAVEELKAQNLWCIFDRFDEFSQAIIDFVKK